MTKEKKKEGIVITMVSTLHWKAIDGGDQSLRCIIHIMDSLFYTPPLEEILKMLRHVNSWSLWSEESP